MLILASASPRRRELLRLITEDFAVVTSDVDETLSPAVSPAAAVEELARRKALAVLAQRDEDIVIGADTVVAVEGEILGKPQDAAHAAAMLRLLAGRSHTVYTGVAIADRDGCHSFVCHTRVRFGGLDESRIAAYIASGEPMDKAGAYGIQGKGALFITAIHGDYYTVMGLPVNYLAQFLQQKYGIAWNL